MSVKQLCLVGGVVLGLGTPAGAVGLPELFRPGTTILFQGDSITHGGRLGDMNHFMGHGYQAEIAMRYLAAFPRHNLKFLNRAESGDNTECLLSRWEVDAVTPTADETGFGREFGYTNQVVSSEIPLRPDYLSILIGVNDQGLGIPLDEYASNLVALVDRALIGNPKLKIVLGEPFRCPRMTKAEYVAKQTFVRNFAKVRGFAFVPYQKLYDEKLLKLNPDPSYWSWDGCHPTYAAHSYMAELWIRSVERTFGSGEKIRDVSDTRLKTAFGSNPGRDVADWTVENRESRLEISQKTFRGEPCAFVTRTAGGDWLDTSFAFTSRRFAVSGGEDFILSVRLRGTYSLRLARGRASPCVRFFGADGKTLGEPFAFTCDVLENRWYAARVQGAIPVEAVEAEICLGADRPDVRARQYLALSDVTFATCAVGAVRVGEDRPAAVYGRPPKRAECGFQKNLIDDRGFVRADGQPFFPIGLLGVEKGDFGGANFDSAFRDLKAAGFNMVQGKGAEFLDAAERNGLKALVPPSAAEKNRKGVGAWYIGEDASDTTRPLALRSLMARCHKADPTRLTAQADLAVDGGVSLFRPYVEASDVFLPKLYTLRTRKPTGEEVPSVISDMKTIAADLAAYPRRRRSVWPVIPDFRDGDSRPRLPTAAERRAMTYEAIIHGANGIFFRAPGRWKEVATLAGELAEISVDLVCANAKVPPRVEIPTGPLRDALDYKSVSVLLKDSPRGRLLLACNSAAYAVEARITVPDFRGAKVLFEDGRELPAGAALVDSFKPLEVHVYRFL